jgi:hypothetical protein
MQWWHLLNNVWFCNLRCSPVIGSLIVAGTFSINNDVTDGQEAFSIYAKRNLVAGYNLDTFPTRDCEHGRLTDRSR